MNWDALGAIGEVVGAIAVLVTLVYLARQIHEGNSYARARTIQETNATYIQVFSQLTQDADMALLYRRGMAGEELDEGESARFSAFANTFFAWLETAYFQATAAYLSEAFTGDDNLVKVVFPYATKLLNVEAVRVWWETEAPYLYSPSFVAVVNKHLTRAHDAL